MILRLEQVSRLPQRKHQILTLDRNVLYEAGVPKATESYLDLNGTRISTYVENISTARICRDAVPVGQIVHKLDVTKKILFLPIGIEYCEILLDGETYRAYDVGMGAGGHFVPILCGERTVAMIHKDDRVVNYLNTHTVYAEDAHAMELALICAMYLESTAFCDRSAGLGYSVSDNPYYSAQKELRAKYDPDFIPRIKAMDGISEE